MDTRRWLSLAACLFLVLASTKSQQIITAVNVNQTGTNITWDPFLDDEEFEKDYPFVSSLKFHLKDETMIDFFTRLVLLEMDCPIAVCNITIAHIIEATQLARFSTDDIVEAIGRINISPDDAYNILYLYEVNPAAIENLLQIFGLTFSAIYDNFVQILPNSRQTILDILQILNVSVTDYSNAQLFGGDAERLRVWATGNYSQKNLYEVLNKTGKTALDVLKVLPFNTIAGQINKLNAYELLNFVKNLGVTSNNLQNFYRYLNVTHINFLSHPSFIKVVTDTYNYLNAEEVLGVIVSKYKIVTSNKAKALLTYKNQNTELVRNYAKFYVELVENPLMQYPVKNVSLYNPGYQAGDIAIVETTTPFQASIAEISKNYNASMLFNCTYVTKLPAFGIYSENVAHVSLSNQSIVMRKGNETIYNLGSPIFCQDKLYGIAVQDNSTNIRFSTFLKTAPGATVKPGRPEDVTSPNTSGTKPNSGAIISYSVFSFVMVLVAVMLS